MQTALAPKLTPAEVADLLRQWNGLAWELAHRWARKYPQFDVEELYGEAVLGFVEAARRFDPASGWAFGTYAGWYARKNLQTFLRREAAGGLHVPQAHGTQYVRVKSLDAPVAPHDDRGEGEFLPAPEDDGGPDLPADFWARLDRLVGTQRARAVRLYYRDGLNDRAVAAALGVSKARAQQVRNAALEELRAAGFGREWR